jgi:hypothetical protein
MKGLVRGMKALIPRMKGLIRQMEAFIARIKGLIHRMEAFIPRTDAFIPRIEAVIPRTVGLCGRALVLVELVAVQPVETGELVVDRRRSKRDVGHAVVSVRQHVNQVQPGARAATRSGQSTKSSKSHRPAFKSNLRSRLFRRAPEARNVAHDLAEDHRWQRADLRWRRWITPSARGHVDDLHRAQHLLG